MGYWDSVIGQLSGTFWLQFILTPLVSGGILFTRLRRRNHFAVRLVCAVLLYLVIGVFAPPYFVRFSNLLPWTIFFVTFCLCAPICFDHNLKDILFVAICAFAITDCVNVLIEFYSITTVSMGITFGYVFTYLIIDVVAFVLEYFLLARKIPKGENILLRSNFVYVIALFLLVCITGGVLSALADVTWADHIIRRGFKVWLNILIIMLMYMSRKNTQLINENSVLEQFIEKDKEQFLHMREYMEVIDMKCHDFKKLFNENGSVINADSEIISEFAQSVDEYRNIPKTGNDALDVVLYDKIIICKKNQITFTYMVDSKALESIKSVDIASIFNNLLYNAMEYVVKFEDVNKRLISLAVNRKGNFLFISVENYCEDAPEYVNGLPKTQKKGDGHGLGLKSVKYVVNGYGGTINIDYCDNLFSVNVLIPISASAKEE